MKMLTLLLLIGVVLADDTVVHMSHRRSRKELSQDQRPLFNFLMTDPLHKKQASRLGSYSFKNCGDPTKELMLVSQLTISPDPVPTSGSLNITFRAQARTQITSPVQTSLTIKKEVLGVWITVPCVDDFGSCSYSDFCQLLSKISSCPPPFVKNGVPCHCPIPANNYTLPGISVDVDLGILPPGGYTAKFDFQGTSAPVGCYQVDFTLK